MPRHRLSPQSQPGRRGSQLSSTGAILEAAKARVGKLDERHEVRARNNPLDHERLQRDELQARMAYGRAKREGRTGSARVVPLGQWGLARWNRTRLMRSLNLFFFHYGTVMAAGAAYMMFFSVTAMLWAGFSVAGIIIGGNPEYQDLIIESVQTAVPGLISDGGLISESQARDLFILEGLNLSLGLAVVVALVTSLSWLHGLRAGIRSIWERPLMAENVIFVKLKDFGMLLILGVIAIVSSVLGLLSHGLITEVLDFLGWTPEGQAGMVLQPVSFGISFALDMIIAVLLMRVASRLVMPVAALWQSALIAGVGASLLRLVSSQLLQNFADSPNPLLNTFGTVLGVFFYFFIFGLVYLFAASWGAIAASDHADRP
ncbi:YihY/virulence factor BrkB family protein [Nesterenkonia sphaerica]|uniref:YihY/virulence factor BrkB family protein n=1 Tax=Nesterenkonia sphaerica TaxID=1804988 RepID=A0A5R9ADY2_9MICC|nr:YihY/virulence factor BrkB family protein [Nesterenkonia sphaerica]TLP76891.1 YihY/virulence factor BrkB family protein [Nesterenkonia sphaerica]